MRRDKICAPIVMFFESYALEYTIIAFIVSCLDCDFTNEMLICCDLELHSGSYMHLHLLHLW